MSPFPSYATKSSQFTFTQTGEKTATLTRAPGEQQRMAQQRLNQLMPGLLQHGCGVVVPGCERFLAISFFRPE